jgi:hypothetical protein
MQGAFVIISGEIGKLNPEDVTVRTPTNTIGIRGTKYGVSADQEGRQDTIYSQDGAYQIIGSDGADIVDGVADNDTITVARGADEIDGGSVDDWFEDGSSNDISFGRLGEDSIFGDSGNDLVNGGDGNDTLTGGSGDDFLFGGDGDDYAHGGSGDDLFQVDTGAIADWNQGNSVGGNDPYDATTAAAANAADGNEIGLYDVTHAGIDGGSGHDTLQINSAADTTINLGEGNYEDMVDSINNNEAIDLTGGDGNITLGLDFDDVIKLTDDDNELNIILGEGDEVNFGDGDDKPVEGTNDDGSTGFTYLDDGGNMMAKINISDDTDNTGT